MLSDIQKVSSEANLDTKSIDGKIISSQIFRNFLVVLEAQICDGKSLNDGVFYAKTVITFIAQKIQNFVQFLPNTLSAILLVLMDICSKVNIY